MVVNVMLRQPEDCKRGSFWIRSGGIMSMLGSPLGGAESGAVLANGQNLELLSALVSILTPEQKAAFLAMLSIPK